MSTSSRRTFDVVVIGAGPSGLISSLYARRAGFSVALIEKLPEPGGMSRSISIANQSVDLGSHRLHYAMGDSCLLYTSPSPRDRSLSRMPSSA